MNVDIVNKPLIAKNSKKLLFFSLQATICARRQKLKISKLFLVKQLNTVGWLRVNTSKLKPIVVVITEKSNKFSLTRYLYNSILKK